MERSSGVRLEQGDGISVLTIDRPEARNAIGLQTIGHLARALAEVGDSDARVLVLTGGGDRAFVSGGDLKELATIRTSEAAAEMARGMRHVLDTLAALPMPVIAALNGHALGGGAEVAIAADLRLAAADAKIGFTQVALGIMPAWGGAERLAATIGRSRALLLITTGEVLTATRAQEIGLVDAVYERADFDSGWRALAGRFAALPAGATRAIKQVISLAAPSRHPHTETDAIRAFSQLWIADAHWAAVEAAEARRRSG